MNTSVNYSGFIDLLGDFVLEKYSDAEQEENAKQEPTLEVYARQRNDDDSN